MPNNTVPAAAEGLPKITRRAALGAIASLSATGGTVVASAAAGDSEIMKLFREWRALDAGPEDARDRMHAIAGSVESMPATTAAEFAAKLLISTYFGGFEFDEDGPLFAEAMALVGGPIFA